MRFRRPCIRSGLSDGASREISCSIGYETSRGASPERVVCEDSSWQQRTLKCAAPDCWEFPSLSSAYLVSGSGTQDGSTWEISCASKGTIGTTEVLRCESGIWASKSLVCEQWAGVVECDAGQPSGPQVRHTCQGKTAGQKCRASCRPGFRLVGEEQTFTCLDTGSFSNGSIAEDALPPVGTGNGDQVSSTSGEVHWSSLGSPPVTGAEARCLRPPSVLPRFRDRGGLGVCRPFPAWSTGPSGA